MEWNIETCKLEYSEHIEYLLSSLGLYQVDFDLSRTYLLPYQVMIVKYLNKNLIELGSDSMSAKVDKVLKLRNLGGDTICDLEKGGDELAENIGIDVENTAYNTDRFVYAWTDALNVLCLRLYFQYIHLFNQEVSSECCTCAAPGDTTSTYESWVSGAYPEDEMYDRSNYMRGGSSWSVSKNVSCDCYRRNIAST